MCRNQPKPCDRSSSYESEDDNKVVPSDKEIITIDVGGTIFRTAEKNLCRSAYFINALSKMRLKEENVEPDRNHHFFVDRDPEIFGLVLRFLRGERLEAIIRTRCGSSHESSSLIAQLMNEAEFYKIAQLINDANSLLENNKNEDNCEDEEERAESYISEIKISAGVIIALIFATFSGLLFVAAQVKSDLDAVNVGNNETSQGDLFPDPDSWYKISSFHSERVLQVNKIPSSYKANYATTRYNGNFHQQWRFALITSKNEHKSGTSFLITSRSNEPLVIWKDSPTNASIFFKFRLRRVDDGYFFIQYGDNENLVLSEDSQSITEASKLRGARSSIQKWRIDKL